MFRRLTLMVCAFVLMVLFGGCEEENDQNVYYEVDIADVEEIDPVTLMRTNYYYVYNPVGNGGCSNALRLTARGTGITRIQPSGCWIDQVGPAPSWDALTSAGTSTLYDTWYIRGRAFDKDYSSADYQAWCGADDRVTVSVTGTTITQLQYWFTDDTQCFW